MQTDLTIATDRGKLRQLMRRLEQPVPDPVGPATLAQAVGLADPRATPAPAAPAAPAAAARPDTVSRVGDYLGGLLGLDAGATAPVEPAVAAAPLALGSIVARVPVTGGQALDRGAEAQLGRALEQARTADAALRIVGPSSRTGSGLEQARAVAQGLMRLGAPADRLAVATGGSGGEVLVYLAPRARS